MPYPIVRCLARFSHRWHNRRAMGMTTHNLYAWIKKFGPESNAVAESFFQLLKRERIKRHVYATRNEARAEIFDYIEMFYNARRQHGVNDQLSLVEHEARYQERLGSV
jgi:putative transposase